MHIAVWFRNGIVANIKVVPNELAPDENSHVYALVCRYYVHYPHADFRRII